MKFATVVLCVMLVVVNFVSSIHGSAYMSQVHRERRQTKTTWGVGPNGGTIGQQGQWQNDRHRVTGGANAQIPFHGGPHTIGGNVGYEHRPSGSNVGVQASHTKGFGTDVAAQGRGNIWRNQNSRLDAVGSYGRHFGGPGGASRPQTYGGIQYTGRF